MSSEKVRVFEVGPRDGLQNEKRSVSLADKIWMIQKLVEAGFQDLEIGAFVRPDRVPQMADSDQVCEALKDGSLDLGDARGWVLVPNQKGLERAIAVGCRSIAVFTAASDGFNQANVGMSVDESLKSLKPLVASAVNGGIEVRGYVSTAFGCPFDGKMKPARAIKVIDALLSFGCFQVSVGDTIGIATPGGVEAVMGPLLKQKNGQAQIAGHFHDTRGTALANSLRAFDLGCRVFDASMAGLGGCPFAPGATGNLSTEDLVFMLDGMGIETGIDLDRLANLGLKFSQRIGRPIFSRYLQAFASQAKKKAD